MTSSNWNIFRVTGHLNSPVSGEFPAQRPVTRSFDVFLDVRIIKRLSKHSWGWWFETLSHPLWRHRNGTLLTFWGWVTHLCVSEFSIIGSDNGLATTGRQAIILTNTGILLMWILETNFSEILIEIHISLFNKTHLKISSAKCWPFHLGLNVLMVNVLIDGGFPA